MHATTIETSAARPRRSARRCKEARLLLRERRGACLRKYSHRLTPEKAAAVKTAIDALSAAVDRARLGQAAGALNTLDESLDKHLSFARKSTAREYTESIGDRRPDRALLARVRRRGVQDPVGLDDPDAAGRRSHLRQQVHLRRARAVHQHQVRDELSQAASAARSSSSSTRRSRTRTSSSASSPSRATPSRCATTWSTSTASRCRARTSTATAATRTTIEEAQRWEERRCECVASRRVDGNTSTRPSTIRTARRALVRRRATVPRRATCSSWATTATTRTTRASGASCPFDLIKGKAMVIWWSHGEPEGIRLNRMFHLVR